MQANFEAQPETAPGIAAITDVVMAEMVELQAPPLAVDPTVPKHPKIRGLFRSWFQRAPAESYAEPEEVVPTKVAEIEGIDLAQAAELIETRGYVCQARRFSEQALDTTRTNLLTHTIQHPKLAEVTEHGALVGLRDFLANFPNAPKARGMLENLTFIGEKEFAEAAEGLAAYWKHWLDSDAETQLCVVTGITQVIAENKSDQYVLERILDFFTDEELTKYAGRLLVDPENLSAPVEKAKIVMLDDWIISGAQMRTAYNKFVSPTYHLARYAKNDRVEINVLAASNRHLGRGLELSSRSEYYVPSRHVPIKAYFLAHDASETSDKQANGAHISGAHSTVDFDFSSTLSTICHEADNYTHTLPALMSVVRRYRTIDRVNFKRVRNATSGIPRALEGN